MERHVRTRRIPVCLQRSNVNFKSRSRIASLMSVVMAVGVLTFVVSPVDASTPAPTTLNCTGTTKDLKAVVGSVKTFDISALPICTATGFTTPEWEYKLIATGDTTITAEVAGNQTSLATEQIIASLSSLKLIGSTATQYALQLTINVYETGDHSITASDTYVFTMSTVASLPAAPSCKDISTYTVADTVTDVIDLNQATNPLGLGCTSTTALTWSFDGASNSTYFGTPTVPADGQATFAPQAGWTTPQAWTTEAERARFTYTVTDEYGQTATGKVFVHVAAALAPGSSCSNIKSEVVFNDPSGNDSEQFRITNKMLHYIDCAQSGSVVVMSWFSLTDYDFVSHLRQAYARGVNVRFLINKHSVQAGSVSIGAWTALKSTLGTSADNSVRNASQVAGNPGGSWALYCNGGCLTPPQPAGVEWPEGSEAEYPALHSKFMMISNVGGKSVVAIASSNPTRAQAVNGWNNAQFVAETAGKGKLFASMDAYFAKLAAQGCSDGGSCPDTPKAASYAKLTSLGDMTFTTFPRPRVGKTANSDDIFLDLNNLLKSNKCIYKDAKGKFQRTQVYVNMFVFTRNSPAMALWRLANNPKAKGGGCDVHVIYTDMDQALKLNGQWLTKKNGYVNWGALDCIATPGTVKGKFNAMTKTERRPLTDDDGNLILTAKGKKRYTTAQVCSKSVLKGSMPTINRGGGYCWFSSKSKSSGGSMNICVSTPLGVTIKDKADNRAKLEAIEDTQGRTRYSHQKYMLIGTWNKATRSPEYITYSGTPNFSNPGLRWNDEILITSTSAETYAQYRDNFLDMKRWIKSRPGSSIGSRKCGIFTSC